MKTCEQCGNDVENTARVCPFCEQPQVRVLAEHRRVSRIKILTVNLEEGHPLVDEALNLMERRLYDARLQGTKVVRLIHSYGSSGTGGAIKFAEIHFCSDQVSILNGDSRVTFHFPSQFEFHKNCGFILTCNYKNRLIPPLHSRCSVIDFYIPNSEKPKLAKEFMGRVISILKDQNIEHDKRVVAEVINKYFPDWRRVLNELQRYSISGIIDAGILVDIAEVNIKELMHSMKNKEFTNVRKWVVNNLDNDPVRLFRRIYDNLYEFVDGSSIPHVVVVLGEYQYKSAFVADQEINLMACFTEIMARAKFK